jgi:mono/diheme cytochrome c family protein
MPRLTLPALAIAASALLGGVLATHAVSAQTTSAPHGDAARGKTIYVAKGCIECHGSLGQGNRSAGPKLAPHPIPYDAFVKQLRAPRAEMPPYDAHILSDQDAANIYAYLQAIPAGKTAAQIPALASVDVGSDGRVTTGASASRPNAGAASLAHGRQLFAANCAACHGAVGTEGGVGPSLKGEKSRKDVEDVAAYVESL